MTCESDLDLCRFDIEQVFVQAELEEDVYVRLPQGCGRRSGMLLVVSLNKGIYGVRQALRSFHLHLASCLLALGFTQYLAHARVFD